VPVRVEILDLYRGRNEFKKGYQPRSKLVKGENDNVLADFYNILNRWKNNIRQLLSANKAMTEIHITEPLVPEPTSYKADIAFEKLKR
jgi:hypothetical protein